MHIPYLLFSQEAQLARELAMKEEANLQLEEHFSSLQEEVEVSLLFCA